MTLKTKKQVILENLQKINKVGDFTIVAETEKVALKKSRLTKAPTPQHLEKVTKVKIATVSMGNSYEAEVNKRLKEEGKSQDFEAKKTYCLPLNQIEGGVKGFFKGLLSKVGIEVGEKFSKIIYRHTDKDQYYVRVYPNLAQDYQSKSVYFDANGNEISKADFEKYEEEYFPLKKKISKQDNPAGKFIDEIDNSQGGIFDKIIVNNYKLENIIYLGDENNQIINELTEETLKIVA